MKFAIKRKERLPSALRRIAGEQLQIAAEKTAGTQPTATSVHCARKAIKRARAVLKLVRCDANRRQVTHDDQSLRDAAKLLAANRDLHVQQVALKRLPICKIDGSCAVVWKRLRAAQNDLRAHTRNDLKQFSSAIKTTRVQVPRWQIDKIDSDFITESLTRSYRRARKRFKGVCRVSTGEKLHGWRRSTKTLWHQLQLIDQITSRKLCTLSCNAARLSQTLGDEHDLFMLLKALADATDADSRAVKRELRNLRRKLTKRAIKLGRKTFELAPSAFHERLSRYVN